MSRNGIRLTASSTSGTQIYVAGVLSGHSTTAGTYECSVSAASNLGTDTKTVNIVVR